MDLWQRIMDLWQRIRQRFRQNPWSPRISILPFVRKNISIVIALCILFVGAGAMSGYSAYVLSHPVNETIGTLCDQNLGSCVSMLGNCKTELAACGEGSNATGRLYGICSEELLHSSASIEDLRSKILDYERNSTELQHQINELNSIIGSGKSATESLNSTLNDLRKQLDDLVYNSARSICCVQKVYNPSLKYYYLSNSTIACTADSSIGTKEFSC
jgi:hypothetical protein